jgi:hypothetical protein
VLVISKDIKTAINYFLQTFCVYSTHVSHRKNVAEHWDLPNTGIFFSKDVASAYSYVYGSDTYVANF